MRREDWPMQLVMLLLVVVIGIGIWAVVKIAQQRAADQASCIASGRIWTIDHYETGYIFVKSGNTTTMIPTHDPVYKCVE